MPRQLHINCTVLLQQVVHCRQATGMHVYQHAIHNCAESLHHAVQHALGVLVMMRFCLLSADRRSQGRL